MSVQCTPYINFPGQARAALAYYQGIFGGSLEMTTYAEGGVPNVSAATADNIMHGQLTAEYLTLMIADAPDGTTNETTSNISLTLSGNSAPVLTAYFESLAAEGTILEPLAIAPWGDQFGMLTDKYGVRWMFNIVAN